MGPIAAICTCPATHSNNSSTSSAADETMKDWYGTKTERPTSKYDLISPGSVSRHAKYDLISPASTSRYGPSSDAASGAGWSVFGSDLTTPTTVTDGPTPRDAFNTDPAGFWVGVAFGMPGSLHFRTVLLDGTGKMTSPWHHVPLHAKDAGLNFVCMTPKGSWLMCEPADNEDFTPIRVAKVSGKPGHYSENSQFNLGILPQTWADPEKLNEEYGGLKYDGRPIQAIEIGKRTLRTGGVYNVKPVGAFAVVERRGLAQGDTCGFILSWKILVMRTDDELAPVLRDVNDIKVLFPKLLDNVRDWLRICYRLWPDDPPNTFGHNERAVGMGHALSIIAQAHADWQLLTDDIQPPSPWAPAGLMLTAEILADMWAKFTYREANMIPIPVSSSMCFEEDEEEDLLHAPEVHRSVTSTARERALWADFEHKKRSGGGGQEGKAKFVTWQVDERGGKKGQGQGEGFQVDLDGGADSAVSTPHQPKCGFPFSHRHQKKAEGAEGVAEARREKGFGSEKEGMSEFALGMRLRRERSRDGRGSWDMSESIASMSSNPWDDDQEEAPQPSPLQRYHSLDPAWRKAVGFEKQATGRSAASAASAPAAAAAARGGGGGAGGVGGRRADQREGEQKGAKRGDGWQPSLHEERQTEAQTRGGGQRHMRSNTEVSMGETVASTEISTPRTTLSDAWADEAGMAIGKVPEGSVAEPRSGNDYRPAAALEERYGRANAIPPYLREISVSTDTSAKYSYTGYSTPSPAPATEILDITMRTPSIVSDLTDASMEVGVAEEEREVEVEEREDEEEEEEEGEEEDDDDDEELERPSTATSFSASSVATDAASTAPLVGSPRQLEVMHSGNEYQSFQARGLIGGAGVGVGRGGGGRGGERGFGREGGDGSGWGVNARRIVGMSPPHRGSSSMSEISEGAWNEAWTIGEDDEIPLAQPIRKREQFSREASFGDSEVTTSIDDLDEAFRERMGRQVSFHSVVKVYEFDGDEANGKGNFSSSSG